MSAVSKPMMAVFTFPLWIFFARTIDRLGKGLRTAARDALLSQNATPETKARVFGLHRGMDTTGAVTGPVLALLFLHFFPHRYKPLFYWAFFPGLIAVALIFLLKEKRQPSSTLSKGSFFSFFSYWKVSGAEYKKLVAGLLVFSLFNSSDVFLLLKAKEVTGSDTVTITSYIFYNLVFAIASYPLGSLADRIGIKPVFTIGLLLFSVVYFLFGLTSSATVIFVSFFLYGMYAAATEGLAKAWITNLSHGANTATAIGFYTSCQGICTLLASSLAGWLWSAFNSRIAFFTTSVVTVVVTAYFLFYVFHEKRQVVGSR